MQLDLRNRRALITGGMNGIGRASAEALTACGAHVIVVDLASEQPETLAPAFAAKGIAADVTDPASLESAFAQVAPIDILVANAGTAAFAPLEDTSHEVWNRLLSVNLTGVFNTIQIAARHMKPRRAGAVIVTASTNSFDGEPNLIAYNSSKAGLLGIVRTAAAELGPYGIRVNAVCPGFIRTRLTTEFFDEPGRLKEYFRQIPLGRSGEVREIGNAVAFLASPLASYITGATLVIDGGQTASKFGTWDESFAQYESDHWELK